MLRGFQNEALSSPAHAPPPETSGTGLFLFLRQAKTEPSLSTPATILSCLLVAALPSWRCLCHTLWGS
ncbi:hypothetical protein ACRRTK_020847 [Alexandromys fortis]